MYKRNGTREYIRLRLSEPEGQQYLMEKARDIDASQLEKKRRLEQAEADHALVTKKRAVVAERAAKLAKRNPEIDSVMVRWDTDEIRRAPGANKTLDLELKWFRRLDNELKVEALCTAIQRYKTKAPLLSQDRVAVAPVEAEKALDASGYDSDFDIDFNK
ncbi:hypothetical protein H0H92_010311 [Tricholoma furcatifolium]|nr:hypothetical protein H0H92_010311 [Tricholoma furcatifolium]